MIQYIRQYYNDEKIGAFIGIAVASFLLMTALVILISFNANQLTKGIGSGLMLLSIAALLIAASSLVHDNRKILEIHTLSENVKELQNKELARMDKMLHVTFRVSFFSFSILMAVAMSVIILARTDYWKGVGISLMIILGCFIISDSFSLQRNEAYRHKISYFQCDESNWEK